MAGASTHRVSGRRRSLICLDRRRVIQSHIRPVLAEGFPSGKAVTRMILSPTTCRQSVLPSAGMWLNVTLS
ncbi:MAG: hypothetical protein IJ154_07215 [Bacteroidales bacterium]|nr:hypothetical protein [Bacteroidales bacterium]